jgi:hypothetical protein
MSFAVVTAVLNEHDYLNYFVEHYLGLGFQKIYVLIDNSTSDQIDYELKPEIQSSVQFIFVTDLFKKFEVVEKLLRYNHKAVFIHEALQVLYKKYVTEDYCLLAGVDSFLYMDGKTIQEYFFQNNIGADVAMIFFHWYTCVNNKIVESEYNLLNTINSDDCFKSSCDHFFTLGKRDLVDCPSDDSHYYKINNPVKCMYNNQIVTVKPQHDFWNISKNICKIHSTSPHGHPCIIHFMIRSVNDCLIKYFYQWSTPYADNQESKINNIRNIILNKPTDSSEYEAKLHYLTYKNHVKGSQNIFTNFEDRSVGVNDQLLRKLLKECNIKYLEYINWCLHFEYM